MVFASAAAWRVDANTPSSSPRLLRSEWCQEASVQGLKSNMRPHVVVGLRLALNDRPGFQRYT